jgi:hypothetical protein
MTNDIWKDTSETPTRDQIGKRVVFVENKAGDIQSTKVSPSEWKMSGFVRWTFADDLLEFERLG